MAAVLKGPMKRPLTFNLLLAANVFLCYINSLVDIGLKIAMTWQYT